MPAQTLVYSVSCITTFREDFNFEFYIFYAPFLLSFMKWVRSGSKFLGHALWCWLCSCVLLRWQSVGSSWALCSVLSVWSFLSAMLSYASTMSRSHVLLVLYLSLHCNDKAILGLLPFHMYFRINQLVIIKWFLIENWIKCTNQTGKN